jgi:hypothetical protein
MKNIFSLIISIFVSISAPAYAATIQYSITGIGSGSLNGFSFSQANFSIDLNGDSSNLSSTPPVSIINPLQSAVVTIFGFSPTTLNIPTQIGFNSNNNAIFFARSGSSDFFDFFLSAPVDISSAFGPVTGTNVFALTQFQDVSTTGGLLSFNNSSDVTFSAVFADGTVPEPATLALMGLGFAGMGYMSRRRQAQA